jgi:hypothetical protein
MKRVYWDTSALILALEDAKVRQSLAGADSVTRPHTLAELFSTLTGGRLNYQCTPDQAWELIENLIADLSLVDLTAREMRQALSEAGHHGVRGGRVHDYLHARTAGKCKAVCLMTLNLSDFEGLCPGIQLTAP